MSIFELYAETDAEFKDGKAKVVVCSGRRMTHKLTFVSVFETFTDSSFDPGDSFGIDESAANGIRSIRGDFLVHHSLFRRSIRLIYQSVRTVRGGFTSRMVLNFPD